MSGTRQKIKSMYTINLIEGEGLGTAYEYYVKLKKLKRFTDSIGKIKRVLIAGLPEKYGLSMDFLLLSEWLKAKTIVIDEREGRLKIAQEALGELKSREIMAYVDIEFLKVSSLARFDNKELRKEKFDLALSSEVLQRLDDKLDTYISNLRSLARYIALFAPNRRNKSHTKISGLQSVSLEELLDYFILKESESKIFDFGYLDIPPFPPGVSRSKKKREKAAQSKLESLFMRGLEVYSLCEEIMPRVIKAKKAHITYVMIEVLHLGCLK